MKFIDKYNAIQKIGSFVDVPYEVYCILGIKKIYIIEEQVQLGEDLCTLEKGRAAIAWYVEQLGGKVVWSAK